MAVECAVHSVGVHKMLENSVCSGISIGFSFICDFKKSYWTLREWVIDKIEPFSTALDGESGGGHWRGPGHFYWMHGVVGEGVEIIKERTLFVFKFHWKSGLCTVKLHVLDSWHDSLDRVWSTRFIHALCINISTVFSRRACWRLPVKKRSKMRDTSRVPGVSYMLAKKIERGIVSRVECLDGKKEVQRIGEGDFDPAKGGAKINLGELLWKVMSGNETAGKVWNLVIKALQKHYWTDGVEIFADPIKNWSKE